MNKLKHYIIFGTFFVIIFGTLSHFIYDWTANNAIIGFFVPINESVWEHMKLSFFPMLLYCFYMNIKLKDNYPCITAASCFGILLSTFLIPAIFYLYTSLLGYNTLILDIGTFLISVIISFAFIYKLTQSCNIRNYTVLLKICILLLTFAFIIFTYYPPDFNLFVDFSVQTT